MCNEIVAHGVCSIYRRIRSSFFFLMTWTSAVVVTFSSWGDWLGGVFGCVCESDIV